MDIMTTQSERLTITVSILDKEYLVHCAQGEQEALMEAARHLDDCMRQIRGSGKIIGNERIAVMAALNMSHGMLQSDKKLKHATSQTQKQVGSMLERLNNALNNPAQRS
ncbi:MAG: cell division protein ZapA [Kistimonas sp.]|nr:cell division protein ZapA [Kistimonas sp.]